MEHIFAEAEESIRMIDNTKICNFRKQLGRQMMSFMIRCEITRADAVAAELLELMRVFNILHYVPPQMLAMSEMRTIRNNNKLNNTNRDNNNNNIINNIINNNNSCLDGKTTDYLKAQLSLGFTQNNNNNSTNNINNLKIHINNNLI